MTQQSTPWTFRTYMQPDSTVRELRDVGLEPTPALTNEGQRTIMGPSGPVALVNCQTKFKRGQGYKTECAERDANARLIAAAPVIVAELKNTCDALRYCLAQLDDTDLFKRKVAITLEDAEAAITAAGGDRPAAAQSQIQREGETS